MFYLGHNHASVADLRSGSRAALTEKWGSASAVSDAQVRMGYYDENKPKGTNTNARYWRIDELPRLDHC